MHQKNPRTQSKVIGAVGLNGSGKNALIRHLQRRCGLEVLSLGDVARELAHLEEVAFNRDNLHDISEKYLEKYGKDFFIKGLIEEITRNQWEKVGVTGIRSPTDVESLRQQFGSDFLLIHVQVENPATRFERLQKRGEARDPQNYEDFLAQEKNEKDLFRVDEAIQRADVSLANAGTLEDFHQDIDRLISRHQFFRGLDCQA